MNIMLSVRAELDITWQSIIIKAAIIYMLKRLEKGCIYSQGYLLLGVIGRLVFLFNQGRMKVAEQRRPVE